MAVGAGRMDRTSNIITISMTAAIIISGSIIVYILYNYIQSHTITNYIFYLRKYAGSCRDHHRSLGWRGGGREAKFAALVFIYWRWRIMNRTNITKSMIVSVIIIPSSIIVGRSISI